MPKIIELTVQVDLNKVSCPGVWLCQDGRVSLSVAALGTNFETCMLPPIFPLVFKDNFFYRKRFQQTCAMSNICCLLRDETVYCELLQWSRDCSVDNCKILAQYLGALNDVLFPPHLCSTDGVDLLMRRTVNFPGILSPKIEISTKVRIDEIFCPSELMPKIQSTKPPVCSCKILAEGEVKQRAVCHTGLYHENMCNNHSPTFRSRPRSKSRSNDSKRSCSTNRSRSRKITSPLKDTTDLEKDRSVDSYLIKKVLLESNYVENEVKSKCTRVPHRKYLTPCVCEICKRYHELFHAENQS